MPELTRKLISDLPQNGPTDPILFYRRPLVGWLYRERINLGLRLLPPRRRFESVLEVGYGSGALLLTLAPIADKLTGLDLDADPAPVKALLGARGIEPTLQRGSVYEIPASDASFDLVVSYSVFEHLLEYPRALAEVRRVLRPDGLFLLGMPAVNPMMEAGFRAIGFKGIRDHHVTTPRSVSSAFGAAGLRVIASKDFVFPVPWVKIYYTWLLDRG